MKVYHLKFRLGKTWHSCASVAETEEEAYANFYKIYPTAKDVTTTCTFEGE